MKKSKTTSALLTALMTAGLLAGMIPATVTHAAATHPLITEVYSDTNVTNEPEEYVAITNPTASTINIGTWQIKIGSYTIKFPSTATLAANQTVYVTKTATIFNQQLLMKANYEYGSDSDSTVPQMTVVSSIPTLANAGGAVSLLDSSGALVDAMEYGTGTLTSGWTGTSVPVVSEGVIYVREKDETTQQYPDIDQASDWAHMRVYGAGQSRFGAPTNYYAGTLQQYSSPDNSYNTVVSALNAATTSIDFNIYEFTSYQLYTALKNAATRGVKVRLFIEGGIVGGISDQEKYIAQQLVAAGVQVRYIINNPSISAFQRYDYDHAKYAVIDNNKAFVESENWSASGIPTNNNYGNRGWGILINDPTTAAFYENVFNYDFNVNAKDSFPFTPTDATYGNPPSGFVPDQSTPTSTYKGNFINKPINGEFNLTPIMAPDSTFLKNTSIIGLARQAQKSLYVEQLYIKKYWGSGSTGSLTTTPDVYLEEVINAARRGVKVRVLLDSAFLDTSDPRDNTYTVQYINDTAAAEHLDMQAKLIDLKTLGLEKVHNKGMLVDGQKTLVSSINWSENSPESNREAGVIIDNTEVNAYYEPLFWYDWTAGAQHYNPEEAKGTSNVVISEVNYNTNGSDSTKEYVELYNKNNVSVDLSNYKLTNKSGSFTLPSGTVIPAHSFLMVGQNSAAFATYKGFGLDVSGNTLTLTNTGDQLQLKNTTGTVVDSVAWM
ncbi:MAG: phospholipase D-like domain-containing protein, partial [Tumebacillaceae bacterium]